MPRSVRATTELHDSQTTTTEEPVLKITGAPHAGQLACKAIRRHPRAARAVQSFQTSVSFRRSEKNFQMSKPSEMPATATRGGRGGRAPRARRASRRADRKSVV